MDIDKKLLRELKSKLEQEKKRLTKDLKFFAKKDSRIKGNWLTRFPFFGRDRSDDGPNAEEVEEYATLLPVEHTLESRLKDINDALEKIKTKNYGKCEKCNKIINRQRLKANPEARVCLDCGKKQ